MTRQESNLPLTQRRLGPPVGTCRSLFRERDFPVTLTGGGYPGDIEPLAKFHPQQTLRMLCVSKVPYTASTVTPPKGVRENAFKPTKLIAKPWLGIPLTGSIAGNTGFEPCSFSLMALSLRFVELDSPMSSVLPTPLLRGWGWLVKQSYPPTPLRAEH